MAIALSSISRGPRIGPPRLIVYGPHGVGKTTFSAQAPSPILLPLEDGQGVLDIPAFTREDGSSPLKTYAEVSESLAALYEGEHQFQSIIVDSLDWLEPLVWKETCARNNWEDIESPGYGKGYLAADDVWREFFSGLVALREVKKMSVILLAHCEITKFNDPNSDPYDRYQIKLHKRASAIAQEWADAVLFANFRVYTSQTDVGFNKKVTRGIGTGERVLFTEERPAHLAKNRYSLPAEIPFTKETGFQDLMGLIFRQPPQSQQNAA